MYVPKHLRPTESDDVMGFIRQHSFGLLVGTDEAGLPIATHIPMLLSERDGQAVLLTHVARPNPIWRMVRPDKQLLAVFSGPHAYVSASWYDHENVPTWNYVAVHVYGRARVLDEAETIAMLTAVTDTFEAGRPNRVAVETYSDGFVQREMRGLVGLEIRVDDIQAVYKLSQNRDDLNHAAIVTELSQSDDAAARQTAELMRERRNSE
jgi:transcriptional regulator